MIDSPPKLVNVLLAEDSKTQAKLVQTAFKQVEHLNLLDVVENGTQALAYLRCEGVFQGAPRPDLLLLDINMPEMDGFEVLREMKSDPQLRRIPVVMLTTSSDEEDIAQSYENGASTYITKPLDFSDLERIFEFFAIYWGQIAKLPPAD